MNVTVKVSGPFFSASPSVILDSIHGAVQEVVLTGEREAKLMAQPEPGSFHSRGYAAAHGYSQTGHYNRSIHGVMVGSLHGSISDSGVIYGPWLEGVSSRNQASRYKGVGIFRKTRDKLQRDALGILEKHIRRLVDKLT